MMIYKNAQENKHGSIDCLILLNDEWLPTTQDPDLQYELSEDLGSDDWAEIKPCDQAEKDAYLAQQEQEILLAELSALDLPTYTIERALAGDQYAIQLINENEQKKALIRAKL